MENKVRSQLIDMYIKSLNEGELPWHRGWDVEMPINPVTHKSYRGVNRLLLQTRGYDDPRWLTFRQAQNSGWKVKKNEHGTPVEYWSIYDREMKQNISIQDYSKLPLAERVSERYTRILKMYTVFNAQQIDGIEPYVRLEKHFKLSDVESVFIPKVIANMKINVEHTGNEAYYFPKLDIVKIPPKEKFHDKYEYTSTLLHELSHATSHTTRMNRAIEGTFGSQEYAKEELRAEISSSFVSGELNIKPTPANLDSHKAYIQNWIKILNNDPNELFRAISESQKISDYLLENGEYKTLIQSENIDNQSKIHHDSENINEVLTKQYESIQRANQSNQIDNLINLNCDDSLIKHLSTENNKHDKFLVDEWHSDKNMEEK